MARSGPAALAHAPASPVAQTEVRPGHVVTSVDPVVLTATTDAAVVVCVWDRRRRSGGMCHYTEPHTADRDQATPRYGNVAVSAVVRLLERSGSATSDLVATIVGGAASGPIFRHAQANVEAARLALGRRKVPIQREHVGGRSRRTARFTTRDGRVDVSLSGVIALPERASASAPLGLMDSPDLDAETFQRLRALIYRSSGITLGDNKQSLVRTRIRRRLIALGLSSPRDYVDLLAHDDSGDDLANLLDAISTNTTQFFREPAHFKIMVDVVREWARAGKRPIRIWCAASSTGQEPYTIAMALTHAFESDPDYRGRVDQAFAVLATDISRPVLQKARSGIYDAKEIADIPEAMRRRFFQPVRGGWQVSPDLRALVRFGRLNLVKHPIPLDPQFDIIFCRNVMIYFDADLRSRLACEFARLLVPGGILFVGHVERAEACLDQLSRVGAATYRKKGG